MIPTLSIVGKSNSGKTTLLEKLIGELTRRGLRVAAVKHDAHHFEIDHQGKDSYRLYHAGAGAVLISSPEKIAMVRRVDAEWPLDSVLAQLGDDFDVILTEGYKGAAGPKIEVLRAARSTELVCSQDEILAVATDVAGDYRVPRFQLDDIAGIADFIETEFLARPLQTVSAKTQESS